MIATGTSNRGTSPHRPLQDQHTPRSFKITFGTRCSSTAVTPLRGWLDARGQASRDRIEVVAIDPAAAFRRRSPLLCRTWPSASTPFHLVQQANLMVASVRKHDLEVRHRHRDRRHKGAVRNSSAIVGCCYPRLTVGQTVGQPTRTVADISDPAEVGAADSIDIGQAG